jgi:hypothetical protein
VKEGEHFDHLWRFADKGDGYMDEVDGLRDKYDADVAVLIVDDAKGVSRGQRPSPAPRLENPAPSGVTRSPLAKCVTDQIGLRRSSKRMPNVPQTNPSTICRPIPVLIEDESRRHTHCFILRPYTPSSHATSRISVVRLTQLIYPQTSARTKCAAV